MKSFLRSMVPVLSLLVLIPAARASSPAEARPSGWLGLFLDNGAEATDSASSSRRSNLSRTARGDSCK